MIFSFIDSFSFLLMASPPDVPPIKPLRDLSHLVNTLIQHYLFVHGGIQRKRNTGAGYSELFQARLILTAFDRSDSKALSSYGVEMRNGRTEVEGAGRCRGDSNETRSFRPTERAGREESSHIKVLSRKKRLAPTCPTIPACREVDSDKAYFSPGKQHYFHFLPHCRLSSRCTVSYSAGFLSGAGSLYARVRRCLRTCGRRNEGGGGEIGGCHISPIFYQAKKEAEERNAS